MVLLEQQSARSESIKLPAWLRQDLPDTTQTDKIKNLLNRTSTRTVCQDARCPNLGACWGRGVATFMILGGVCTRACRFCAITTGQPGPLDPKEPARIAQAVKQLGLRYVVITSVTRDDLEDGGAQHFVKTVLATKALVPGIKIELLIPDFQLNRTSLKAVVTSQVDVVAHNMETVQRLYPAIRPQADYSRSLEVLKIVKKLKPSIITKTGFMVGLGETEEEVKELLQQIRDTGCEMVTVGQYLRPLRSQRHVVVERYVHPDIFAQYSRWATDLGFRHVFSAPLVRSSFLAEEGYVNCLR